MSHWVEIGENNQQKLEKFALAGTNGDDTFIAPLPDPVNESVEPPQESARVEDVPQQIHTQAKYTVQVKIRTLYCFLVNGLMIFRRTNPIDKTTNQNLPSWISPC